jgi:flagellar biosynthesis protein FlhF
MTIKPSETPSQLQVKSYFVPCIEEALERARLELGPDALLLNEREAPPEARHLGQYEVVFGVRPQQAPAALPDSPVRRSHLRECAEELRDIVRGLREAPHSELREGTVAEALCSTGVSARLASDIECAARQRLRNGTVVSIGRTGPDLSRSSADLGREIAAELASRIAVAPEIGPICALIGPAGAGKTCTLVKLAIQQGLAARRAVRLLSMRSSRIAGTEQLRAYASILDVPFTVAETPAALAQAIDNAPTDEWLLIDTPGQDAVSLRDSGNALAAFFRSRQDIDTHLVLTASMRPADLARTVDAFLPFGPAKLLFTRLDETDATAAMFCEAARTGMPLSFFGTGQSIPEDLEPASTTRVVGTLVRQLPDRLAAVA